MITIRQEMVNDILFEFNKEMTLNNINYDHCSQRQFRLFVLHVLNNKETPMVKTYEILS